eukprot:327329-Hanusia_phi.AAC.2
MTRTVSESSEGQRPYTYCPRPGTRTVRRVLKFENWHPAAGRAGTRNFKGRAAFAGGAGLQGAGSDRTLSRYNVRNFGSRFNG